jgi:hypothetical protein
MSDKHTPGPWTYDQGERGYPDTREDPGLQDTPPSVYAIVNSEVGEVVPICTLDEPWRTKDLEDEGDGREWHGDIDANGRLLAAAPLLLDALDAALTLLDEVGGSAIEAYVLPLNDERSAKIAAALIAVGRTV